ncbi:MAG: endonuclease V [Candidatus Tectomicrobia bacterium]|uniref:Endonuclease V n=1 Tax=Tectimicrobiota bacterium TaxID=2528274 RepID=A0A932I2K5_UNCTE|nr:endonuclease V [Candidatus Tectomicrobia bacterium]
MGRPASLLLHSWSLTPAEAILLQRELRSRVSLEPRRRPPRTIAGADISMPRFGRRAAAAIVVCSLPGLAVVEESLASGELRFPYVPGLLSFREGPLLEAAFRGLKRRPDLLLVDGQGIAHPRGLGIASHLGLRLGLCTVGCAKSRLWGEETEPPPARGGWSPLKGPDGGVVGAALRTRAGVKPVYVSPGHGIDLEGAIRWTLAAAPRYRIPEPLRAAHERANAERRRLGL